MAVKKGVLKGAIAASKQTAPKSKGIKSSIPLSQILDRPHGDTRLLHLDHVLELMESIAAVGLIQPIAIDSHGHLLAGGHRRAALQLLEQKQPDRFSELFGGGIPVRRFEFDAKHEPDEAIAIEAAENEKRRDYTREEVQALADRLVEAGYQDTAGRPKKGQKALKPAIAVIIGKSQRTVARYLNPESKKIMTPVTISDEEKTARQMEKLAGKHPKLANRLRKLASDLRQLQE